MKFEGRILTENSAVSQATMITMQQAAIAHTYCAVRQLRLHRLVLRRQAAHRLARPFLRTDCVGRETTAGCARGLSLAIAAGFMDTGEFFLRL